MKWKKMWSSLSLTVLAACALAASASAVKYPDLPENHWAYEQMHCAARLGIISGVGEGRMAPSGELTWGQYLAMLTRTFAAEEYAAAIERGLAWDQAGYAAAEEAKILKKQEFLPVSSETLSQPITRQDVAVLLSRILGWEKESELKKEEKRHQSNRNSVAAETLTDWNGLAADYRPAVRQLCALGIIKGKSDGSFGGTDPLQRADGSVLLMRTLDQIDYIHYYDKKEVTLCMVDLEGNLITEVKDDVYIKHNLRWTAAANSPKGYVVTEDNQLYCTTAFDRYTMICRPMHEFELQEQEAYEKYKAGEMTEEEYYAQEFWLYEWGETWRKHKFLFGDYEKRRFANQAEAEANVVTVTVPVWKLNSDGSKRASTASFRVHAAIGEMVTNIFTEIFNDPEQFPIHSIGGYSWRGDTARGEHNCGTAIDINPNENYQVQDGAAMVGSFWKPNVSPYSIPEDGSVVRVFEKYGWGWGGTLWCSTTDPNRGYHDYMHFSYMCG